MVTICLESSNANPDIVFPRKVNCLIIATIFFHKEKLETFKRLLAEERATRMCERKKKRKEERRVKWRMEKEEARQRAVDEMMKRGIVLLKYFVLKKEL